MKYVEIILKVLRVILRTIFPKKKKDEPTSEPSQEDVAVAQPVSNHPSGPVEERDSTGYGSPGRDPLVVARAPARRGRSAETPWLGISGLALILTGGISFLYEQFFLN